MICYWRRLGTINLNIEINLQNYLTEILTRGKKINKIKTSGINIKVEIYLFARSTCSNLKINKRVNVLHLELYYMDNISLFFSTLLSLTILRCSRSALLANIARTGRLALAPPSPTSSSSLPRSLHAVSKLARSVIEYTRRHASAHCTSSTGNSESRWKTTNKTKLKIKERNGSWKVFIYMFPNT